MPFGRPPACGNKARQEEKVGGGRERGGEGEEKGGLEGRERQMKEGKRGVGTRERGNKEVGRPDHTTASPRCSGLECAHLETIHTKLQGRLAPGLASHLSSQFLGGHALGSQGAALLLPTFSSPSAEEPGEGESAGIGSWH